MDIRQPNTITPSIKYNNQFNKKLLNLNSFLIQLRMLAIFLITIQRWIKQK